MQFRIFILFLLPLLFPFLRQAKAQGGGAPKISVQHVTPAHPPGHQAAQPNQGLGTKPGLDRKGTFEFRGKREDRKEGQAHLGTAKGPFKETKKYVDQDGKVLRPVDSKQNLLQVPN